MRIALAQLDRTPGDVPANRAAFDRSASAARAAGCGVVLFPELADTGYVMAAVREHAGTWPGPAFDAAAAAAREHGIAVVCGLSERTADALHNSVAVFGPDGTPRAKYRKAHLFSAEPVREQDTFTPGDAAVVTELAGETWGLSVCYDLRFPELYRTLAGRGATVLANCTAWPAARAEHWDVLTRARAIENQAFFVGVNRVGTDEGLTFAGRSRVVAPTGELLAEASADREELLVADLGPARVAAFRTAIPAFADRRPELYGR